MTFMSLVPRFYRINDDLILEHSVSGDQEERSQVKFVKKMKYTSLRGDEYGVTKDHGAGKADEIGQ